MGGHREVVLDANLHGASLEHVVVIVVIVCLLHTHGTCGSIILFEVGNEILDAE